MNTFKKGITIAMAIALLSAFASQPALAAGENSQANGVASIEFKEGGTIIDPGPDPDPDLEGIQSRDIYFGKQKMEPSTTTYNSVDSHEDEDRKYAGFIVHAGNNNGWTISAQITGFAIEGNDTMKDFSLKLTPKNVVTTPGNLGDAPTANTITLFGGADKDTPGDSAEIFVAESGKGLGKWGTNWEGDLTVVGGSVAEEGIARATMLWTLVTSDVTI